MNKIILIGNLTKDPELKSTPQGASVCMFTIAVNRRVADTNGKRPADYFRITAWSKLADTCGQYLSKGRKVSVVGELQARTYTAKDGSTQMSLDVRADEVEFLSSGGEQKKDAPQGFNDYADVTPDDIPF